MGKISKRELSPALLQEIDDIKNKIDHLDLSSENVTLDSPNFTATNVKDGMQELQNNLNAHEAQGFFENVHGINDLINNLNWQKHTITRDDGLQLLSINSGSIYEALKDIGTVTFYYTNAAQDSPSNFNGRGMQLVGQQGIGIVLAIDTANNAFWGSYNANHVRINWKPIASSEVEEYPLPLVNGFVNYSNVTAGYDCKIIRTGNLATLFFGCSLLSGNIERAVNIATVPVGLRPKNHISFPVNILRVDNPNVSGTITQEYAARCVLYRNGNLQPFFVAGSLTGNRIFGTITYEI